MKQWTPVWAWRCLSVVMAVVVVCCVSRSGASQRFTESETRTLAFSPTLADPESFTFAMVGDLHVAGGDVTRFRAIAEAAAAAGDSFLVLLGDLADKGDAADFDAITAVVNDEGFAGKTLYVIGNHDIFGEGWERFREKLGPSHAVFRAGNARFITLDTADGMVGEEQTEWLKAQLQQPGPTHTFLLSHYLPVVPGVRTYLRLANDSEAERLMKLASAKRVRGWFGAHYHSYLNAGIAGVTYVIAGGAGGRRMEPVLDYFYVQVQIRGEAVSYELKRVP